MKVILMVVMATVIKCSAWKRRKRKINGLKAKVKSIGPFCFGDQDT